MNQTGRDRNELVTSAVHPPQDREAQRRRLDEVDLEDEHSWDMFEGEPADESEGEDNEGLWRPPTEDVPDRTWIGIIPR